MATTITIDGSPVSLGRAHVPRRLSLPVGGVPVYVFESRLRTLPAADATLGKEITVTVNGTPRFTGDVEHVSPAFRSGLSWVRTYTCLGLRARGDWVGHTDSNTGSDTSTYNASSDLDFVDYLPSRAGKEVGEVLVDVLTMQDNADALDALGIGAYVSLSPPTLPASTLADLAALDRVLPGPIRFGGERLLSAVDQFLSFAAVNHRLAVEADGTLRFLDMLAGTPVSLTLGTDPVTPPDLARDVGNCFTAVVVKGRPVAVPYAFALSNGTLTEDLFAYDALSVAAAKAAYTSADFFSPGCVDQGSCVTNTTTTVTVTSDDASVFWSADFWNQSSGNRYGSISLVHEAGTNITMIDQRLVVDSASLTAGGSSLLTLDRPLPHTDYDRYYIRGRRGGKENVYTAYELPAWAGEKVAPLSSYPYPFRLSSGGGLIQVSTAMGSVLWSASGNPPFFEVAIPVEVDASLGAVIFPRPTHMMAGDREPSDVRAFVPIYNDVNSTRKPASGFEGTAYDAEGLEKVLTVHVPTWRDPANLANMGDYAQDLLDSVKDAAIEGTVVYHGLNDDLLDLGIALDVDSVDFTTPWAGVNLPVVETQLEWPIGEATLWRTTMRVSNRRQAFSDAAYASPERTGVTFDFGGAYLDLSGVGANVGGQSAALMGATTSHGEGNGYDAGAMQSAAAAGMAPTPKTPLTAQSQYAADHDGSGKLKYNEDRPTGPAPVIKASGDESAKAAERQAQSRAGLDEGRAIGAKSQAEDLSQYAGLGTAGVGKTRAGLDQAREAGQGRAGESKDKRTADAESARKASAERDRKAAEKEEDRKRRQELRGVRGDVGDVGGTDGGLT